MGRPVIRKGEQEISKKILLAQPLGSSKRARQRLRWRNEVDYIDGGRWHDMRMKGFLQEAKAQR